MSVSWPGFGCATLPKHAADYARSHGLPTAAIRAAGIRYLDEQEAVNVVGKLDDGSASDGLAVPFPGTDAGVVRFLQAGADPKFKAPFKWQARMYCGPLPPGRRLNWNRIKRDPRVKLFWCEGPLKSLSLTWRGVPAIAFNGLDAWSRDHAPIRDFDLFVWKGRVVVLLVDSDAATKFEARRSIERQADHLRSLGAEVRVVIIPSSSGAKVDVNDYVVAHGVAALLALPETTLPADWSAHDATRELNHVHAFISKKHAEVITEFDDPNYPGTRDIVISQVRDLRIDYLNQQVRVGVKKNGDDIYKSKFEVWLGDPYRREVRRVWFVPGAPWGRDPTTGDWNLWQGWSVTPHAPDAKHHWHRLKDHIAEVIANGNESHANYIFNWLAHGTQFPATPPEVALAAIGGEATGKGVLWRSYGRLYGRHFLHVTKPGLLTSNFNSIMKDKLLIFADENFFAGDHTVASALKTMISEPTTTIEAKFADPYVLPNFRKFVIASNEQWVVPADTDARRYAVFEVSEKRKGDRRYFASMIDELEHGGYEAMLFDLLHRDLTGFDPQKIPQTVALLDQKKQTWGPIVGWWYEKLCDGTLGVDPTNSHWEGFCFRSHPISEIVATAGPRFDRRSLETRVGITLRKLCPRMRAERRSSSGKQSRGYSFPSLDACRKAFAAFCRTPIDWECEAGKVEQRGNNRE